MDKEYLSRGKEYIYMYRGLIKRKRLITNPSSQMRGYKDNNIMTNRPKAHRVSISLRAVGRQILAVGLMVVDLCGS